MGNGSANSPDNAGPPAKQIATWSGATSISSALLVWLAMGGPTPQSDNHDHPKISDIKLVQQELGQLKRQISPLLSPGSVATEIDLEALRRAYDTQILRLERDIEQANSAVMPLLQLSHMVPSMRLAVDDNTEAIKLMGKDYEDDLRSIETRVREMESIVASLQKVFTEYRKWTDKLSAEGKAREVLVRNIEASASRLSSVIEQLQRQMDLFDQLQRNVRERLGRVEDKVESTSTPQAKGRWMEGLQMQAPTSGPK